MKRLTVYTKTNAARELDEGIGSLCALAGSYAWDRLKSTARKCPGGGRWNRWSEQTADAAPSAMTTYNVTLTVGDVQGPGGRH